MTSQEVKKLFEVIAVAYPKFEASKEKLELWTELLEDISFEYGMKKVKNHIKSSRFEPTIADIRAGKFEYPEGWRVIKD